MSNHKGKRIHLLITLDVNSQKEGNVPVDCPENIKERKSSCPWVGTCMYTGTSQGTETVSKSFRIKEFRSVRGRKEMTEKRIREETKLKIDGILHLILCKWTDVKKKKC